MDYVYVISVVFPDGLELGQLQSIIVTEMTTPLFGLFRDQTNLTIRFLMALSPQELAILADIIDNYIFQPQPILNPTGSVVVYELNNLIYRASTSSFTTIGQMPWDNTRYSRYTNATIIILATIFDINLEWRIFDVINLVVLGGGIIALSGTTTAAITNPTTSGLLELQIRKVSIGGQDPEISTVSVEFIN
jgi:hypothetical protein